MLTPSPPFSKGLASAGPLFLIKKWSSERFTAPWRKKAWNDWLFYTYCYVQLTPLQVQLIVGAARRRLCTQPVTAS